MMEEVSIRKLGNLDLILPTLKGSIGFHVAIQMILPSPPFANETCTNKQAHRQEEKQKSSARKMNGELFFELSTNKEVDECANNEFTQWPLPFSGDEQNVNWW